MASSKKDSSKKITGKKDAKKETKSSKKEKKKVTEKKEQVTEKTDEVSEETKSTDETIKETIQYPTITEETKKQDSPPKDDVIADEVAEKLPPGVAETLRLPSHREMHDCLTELRKKVNNETASDEEKEAHDRLSKILMR